MPSRVVSRPPESRGGSSGESSTAQPAGTAGRRRTPASFSSLQRSSSVNWFIWYCWSSLYQAMSSRMVMPGSWALWSVQDGHSHGSRPSAAFTIS